jgi:glycosyltransferase involved in cell wall biosynthesis
MGLDSSVFGEGVLRLDDGRLRAPPAAPCGEDKSVKIAIVSQYYTPESIRIPDSLLVALIARGHEVRVITGYPNYPSGKLFDGYRMRRHDVGFVGGVEVRRVPLYISHSYNPIARLLNYATFACSAALCGKWIRNADVVYVYATQMTPAFGPSVWRWMYRIPDVMHIQDLWPESVTGSSMAGGSFARRAISAVLKPWLTYLYQTAAATIAIAPTMARMLVERGVREDRVSVVYNWATPEVAKEAPPELSLTVSPTTTVVYAGNFEDHQDLDNLLRAALIVHDVPGLRFELVGSGVAEAALKQLANDLGLANVEFVGRVSSEEMERVHRRSDFQFVSLLDLEIFKGTIPSKLQAALCAGKPVITAISGDVETLVRDNAIGLACAPGMPDELALSFRRAAQLSNTERHAMGERARAFYEQNMAMELGVNRIEKVLVNVAPTPTPLRW